MHSPRPTFSTILLINTIDNFSISLNFSDDRDPYVLSPYKSTMKKNVSYLVKDFGLGVKKN